MEKLAAGSVVSSPVLMTTVTDVLGLLLLLGLGTILIGFLAGVIAFTIRFVLLSPGRDP